MNTEQIRSWLDLLIEGRKLLLTRLVDGDDQYYSIDMFDDMKQIHINSYKGIRLMAEALRLEWHHKDYGTDEYPHERWFEYRGITFFAQSQEDTEDED